MDKKFIKLLKPSSIIQTIITFIVSFATTVGFCITCYTHYIEKNIISARQLDQNKVLIEALQVDVHELSLNHNKLLLEINELRNYHHTLDLKISSINSHIKNIIDYQNILRKEVKSIAENKLNIDEFWHIENTILIRLRVLEKIDMSAIN